jgi:1-deoxy-D-xylulose-5-phosphate reductoisomerase
VCALASGSSELDALAAERGVEHAQVGGNLTALLDRAEPDIVLNAVVGFAGLPATLWALERGVTLALANKESLVAAGELALAARERGGGLLLPVDSEHSGRLPVPRGRAPRGGRLARPARVRRPVPRAARADELADVTRAGRARRTRLEHGAEDHDRLGRRSRTRASS